MFSLVNSFHTIVRNHALAKWSAYLLVVLLAWMIGSMVSTQLTPVNMPILPQISLQKTDSGPVRGELAFLFGKPAADATPAGQVDSTEVSPSEVNATRLKLKLVGAIVSQGKGVAIIESSGATLVVKEGEEIINGVDLIKVYSDQIIILHRGKREKLLMEEATEGLFEQASSDNQVVSSSLTQEGKATLKEIGEVLRSQPVNISKYIRFQPVNENGKWVAVKIWPRTEKAVFEGIGFQAGDLLKSINGRTIDEMAQEPALWQTFLNESQFDLTVERNGKLVDLSVDLN